MPLVLKYLKWPYRLLYFMEKEIPGGNGFQEYPLSLRDSIIIGQTIVPGGFYFRRRMYVNPLTKEEFVDLTKLDGTVHTFHLQSTPIHLKLSTDFQTIDRLKKSDSRLYPFQPLPPKSQNRLSSLNRTVTEINHNVDSIYPHFQRDLLPQDQSIEGTTGELKELLSIVILAEKFESCRCPGIAVKKGGKTKVDYCPTSELVCAIVQLDTKSIIIRWREKNNFINSTFHLSQVLNRSSLPQQLRDIFKKLRIPYP